MIALALLALSPQDHSAAFPGGDEAPAAVRTSCDRSASSDEITVCGDRDQSAFRARPLPDRYREQPLRPQFDLRGGGTAKVEAVQRGVGGVSVPSAMVTLRIPLGKKPKPDADATPVAK